MGAVEIEQLTKEFALPWRRGVLRAVENLTLRVGEGEVYGLLGPNGSGKSTTMKIVLGILRATRGECRIFGQPSTSAASRAEVGYVPENPYFYKHLDAVETLRFYGELSGMRGAALRGRIDELLALVDLESARHRRVGGYSKGMLQRIGLAAALVHRPRVLLLDEPTAGVDPVGSRVIRDLILRLKEQGITILLSSHLLEQVQEVCDRVGILSRGRLAREGAIEELLAIESQRELVVEGLDDVALDELASVARSRGAEVVHAGKPKTTLERLFLEVAAAEDGGSGNQQNNTVVPSADAKSKEEMPAGFVGKSEEAENINLEGKSKVEGKSKAENQGGTRR